MDWIKVSIITTNKGIDPVSSVLNDLGYDGLEITPCFPKEWERAEMTRHFRNADYHIVIENPQCRKAVTSVIIVDGTQIKGNRIPDFADNKKHEIKVILQ